MFFGREIRSEVTKGGVLRLSLEQIVIDAPADDEVILRVEAAPINPTDIALLLGPADLTSMSLAGRGDSKLILALPPGALAGLSGRIGKSLPVGLEGAGTVVAAGRSVKALEGRIVAALGRGMFAQFRKLRAADVVVLPEGCAATDGASLVNPLTALGIVETVKREGHRAMVHTAAASSLGRMLVKLCAADAIPLVNIVRSQHQAEMLQHLGAAITIDSAAGDFDEALDRAIGSTGASVVFDAIGGGATGGRILESMERAAAARMAEYSRTGSDVFKQLYVHGALDMSPTVINRPALGYSWAAAGWTVFQFLSELDEDGRAALYRRFIDEIGTTFATRYGRTISLAEALQSDNMRAYARKATGCKYLIDPSRP